MLFSFNISIKIFSISCEFIKKFFPLAKSGTTVLYFSVIVLFVFASMLFNLNFKKEARIIPISFNSSVLNNLKIEKASKTFKKGHFRTNYFR